MQCSGPLDPLDLQVMSLDMTMTQGLLRFLLVLKEDMYDISHIIIWLKICPVIQVPTRLALIYARCSSPYVVKFLSLRYQALCRIAFSRLSRDFWAVCAVMFYLNPLSLNDVSISE